MATHVGVGLSQHRNTRVAGREAAERALAAANVARPDLVLLFGAVGHDLAALLAVVREATGRAPLIGCSVSGCITRGVVDESNFCVEVAVIASDELCFTTAHVPDISRDPEAAGRELGAALRPSLGDDAVALLFLADAFTLNYSAVKKGLDEALAAPRFLPVVGGGANNDVTSFRTFQFHDDTIHEHGACCTLISGAGTLLTSVTHGCYPLGLKQTVTRAEGNKIFEIDHKPALATIEGYISEDEQRNWLHATSNVCLGLETPESLADEYDPLCIRYIVGRDEAAGAILIQTEIAEGTPIWLARRDSDRICREADRTAERLLARLDGRTPKFVLQFECLGRGKLLLSESVKLDLMRRLQRAAPEGTPWIGAYVGGEIGPVADTNMFHNYTAVVAAVV